MQASVRLSVIFILYLFSFAKKSKQTNNNNINYNNIHIHGRVTTTDKPITVGLKIDKISKIKGAKLGLVKERLDGKAKSSRGRG